MNPITMLTQSRKFWLLVLDVGLSLLLYFVGKYAAPTMAEDINFVIAAIQPVFVAVITGIFIEDAALKRSGNWSR